MASSKEDDAAAAAGQQLGALSLGAERNETNEDADTNGTPSKKLCSKCGKESDTLKKCTACKCVWYCDKDCQNRHWKEHKKECKRIKKELAKRGGKLDLGNELDLGPLPDLPPREECPICMRALPLHENIQAYNECCGKMICCGCDFQHQLKNGKWADAGQTMEQVQAPTCAFCRVPMSNSDEETLARLRKRVEGEDPRALFIMAKAHGFGKYGLPVDQAKCINLLRQVAGLGFPPAQYTLGHYHLNGSMGLEQNDEEAIKYWKKAAEGGHLISRHNLGISESNNGNRVAAMRHWRLCASGGCRSSMESLITRFEKGWLHHADAAEVLQAMYCARAELRSEDRDKYIAHLKRTGEYKAEYEY